MARRRELTGRVLHPARGVNAAWTAPGTSPNSSPPSASRRREKRRSRAQRAAPRLLKRPREIGGTRINGRRRHSSTAGVTRLTHSGAKSPASQRAAARVDLAPFRSVPAVGAAVVHRVPAARQLVLLHLQRRRRGDAGDADAHRVQGHDGGLSEGLQQQRRVPAGPLRVPRRLRRRGLQRE